MLVDLSILNAPLDKIEEYLYPLKGIKYLHMDIMDGIFVKETSFNEEIVKRSSDTLKDSIIDVHLMVQNPDPMFLSYKDAGARYITFHYEVGDIKRRIDYIHSLGLKAGLSINPDTDVSLLDEYLKDIDIVLVMSVYPGRGGQSYIESSTEKLRHLYEFRKNNNLSFLINVDGGINKDTYLKVKPYADLAVVGSAITKACDYLNAYNEYKELFK